MSLLSFHLDTRWDWIHLSEQKLHCIVGILDRERVETQDLIVEIAVAIDREGFEDCAFHGNLDASVNYAVIYDLINFLGLAGRFRLIESFACILLKLVLSDDWVNQRQILAGYCRFKKPDILPMATPGVSIYRDQSWANQNRSKIQLSEGILFELIADLDECLISKLSIESNRVWEKSTEEIKVLSGRFEDQGNRLICIEKGILLCIKQK
jgi:dihydroneopterin aldolase